MAEPLIVIGGGEHARVVIEAVRSRGDQFTLLGFVDPAACEETVRRLQVRRLGGDEIGLAEIAQARFIVGVGSIGPSPLRAEIVERFAARGTRFVSVVHAHAWVSPTVTLGVGAVVMAGAVVNAGATIGDHCVINSGAIVEHDVALGAFAQVGPAAAVGGGCMIGAGSYLGLGSRIRDHVRVGRDVTIGMGAVVIDSVADNMTMLGVPARARGRSHA